MDPSKNIAKIEFSDAAVTAMTFSESVDDVIEKLLNTAAVITAFEQFGGAEKAMQTGIEYTKNRYAFGRQVASFQAIKHKFADMFVALELAKSNAYYAAWSLSSDTEELKLAAATARVSASDAYYDISKENIEVHGGMGFTWEFDCHLYYRRAQYLAAVIGTQPLWQEKLVDALIANGIAA
jgi:alkylation response protein AidB-like acyl-CoA dehydrogenase